MDLKQIRTFVYVANLRSFSKAARALNIAQPAVSRQVQALEEDLRTPLLFRTTRGVEPTEAGLTLLTMGENLLAAVEQMRDAVMRAPERARGEATIGLPPSLSAILAPVIVDECRRVFPDVTIHVIEGLSIFLEEWLNLGRLDIAILTDRGEIPAINRKLLAREELVLVGGPSVVERMEEPVTVAQIAELELVITRGFRDVIDPLIAGTGLHLRYALELDSIPIIKDMLARGRFATILPFALVHKEAFAGTLNVRTIREPRLVRDLVLATNSKKPVTSAMKALSSLLVQQVRDIPFAPV